MKDKGRIRRGSYNANLTPVKTEEEERRTGQGVSDWSRFFLRFERESV